jgi:hypothetical protein
VNEFNRLTEVLAREVVRQRQPRRVPHQAPSRRTTRRALATGLHRLADRLETGL